MLTVPCLLSLFVYFCSGSGKWQVPPNFPPGGQIYPKMSPMVYKMVAAIIRDMATFCTEFLYMYIFV